MFFAFILKLSSTSDEFENFFCASNIEIFIKTSRHVDLSAMVELKATTSSFI